MEEEEKRDKKKNLWLREETAAAVDGRERAEAAKRVSWWWVLGRGSSDNEGFSLSFSLSPLWVGFCLLIFVNITIRTLAEFQPRGVNWASTALPMGGPY